MKRIPIPLALAALLLLTGGVLAISSDNYRLDWYTPLTGGGGGPAGSSHYAVNFTVGQSAIGASSSPIYQVCLGYWCGIRQYRIYLPLVLRDYG
ncbi:MAG: hypothetical protein ACK2UC_01310 [Anaerolineae bacterium]|jgi:hypothetical protein